MIVGIIAQQLGSNAGAAARYWRLYMTSLSNPTRWIAAGANIEMSENIGGADVIGSGAASASSESSEFSVASFSFDSDLFTGWQSLGDETGPAWLQYDFGAGVDVNISEISIQTSLDSGPELEIFSTALVQSSSDGIAWVTRWVIPPQSGWLVNETRTFSNSSGLPAMFVSDTQRLNQTTSTTESTFTGVNFGPERAGRLVVVATAASREDPITSMTIGGIAATRAVRSKDANSGNPIAEIWYARPTGVIGDIAITHGGSDGGFIRATAWNIGGVSVAEPADTDSYDTGAAGDLSIIAPSNSVVIACPCGGLSSITLSGLAEGFFLNQTNPAFSGLAQEIVTTGATKTITASTTGARVAACWSI